MVTEEQELGVFVASERHKELVQKSLEGKICIRN